MADYTYLLFNLAVASSLLFAAVWVPEYWRQWRGIVRGLALVSLPFVLWDMLAAHAGHWFFNPRYTLDWHIGGIPIEEILFFITVPLGCMVVWTLLQRTPNPRLIPARLVRRTLWCASVLLALVAIAAGSKWYTRLALLAAAVTCVVLLRQITLVQSRQLIVFQAWIFSLFFVCNTFLTALPIITYGVGAVTGWRVVTIPIEDFLYNFALINLFLVAFMANKSAKTTETAV